MVAWFRMGDASMMVPTHIPGVSVKRSKHGVQHRLRRGRNYAEFAYASDEASHAPARASLIALIDPKPLIRESILGMLGASLPEHRKVLGVPASKNCSSEPKQSHYAIVMGISILLSYI